jgi:hypothetical protein
MKAASLNEIRKQLSALDRGRLEQICSTLARYKKENKELLTYLLFDSHNEQGYVTELKQDVDELFASVPKGNVYFVKKSIRKIIRFINKQIKYSGLPGTELDVRIHFCLKMKAAGICLQEGSVLYNLYRQQKKKIHSVWSRLPEDLQFDYKREINLLELD